MKQTYRTLAYLIAAAVILEASSIALGFFDIIGEVRGGDAYTVDYEGNLGLVIHGIGGIIVVPVLALALLIVAFFTRAPAALRWAGGVLGLVVLQVSLAIVAFELAAVGALHGLNALVLFIVSIVAGRRVGGRDREPSDDRPLETAAL